MRSLVPVLIAATALVATPAVAKEKLAPEAQLAKLLEGRTAGEPQDCITLSSVSDSQVIDKTAIVYRIGGTLWVNRPTTGAESLNDDVVLVTKLPTGRLCSIDTVELHDRTSHFYRGFVGLGKFVPYRRAASD
ncbi:MULTISPECIES: hypothetical protein [Sphingopyxis]|uniref:Secreted protein n=1 Tax=Sphingopyxis granuli TaxID=267128 RepID=A0AA86GNQ3_9SPHN|nr:MULTISPECIES: hypothetical protein [Sphingopyxis]AMG76363.1 Uncharacterized protein SGRAN_4036 [Sphingopyxis granuli]APW73923.1 hypothetical protein BWD40_14915 [Sphingopyxis granuli]AVA15253.1 hypothetical protein C3E99_16595 [Sphingopyxis sp. MG]